MSPGTLFSVIVPALLALAASCAVNEPAAEPASSAAVVSDPGGLPSAAEFSAALDALDSGGPAGPLSIVSVAAARPVATTDERQHLVYELVVRNTGETAIELTRITVVDPARPVALATYDGEALSGILSLVPAGGPASTIAPGGLAIAFFDLALARRRHLPDKLAHRIAFQQGGTAGTVSGPTVAVRDDRARSLGAPLRGDRLLDVGGCCDGPHRRALLATDTGLFVAQRFAIDFVRIDDRSTFAGDPTKNESYFVFGADILAVAPGRIVAATDGMAENIPTQPLPPPTLESAPGNHVVQELDDGRFVLYAHVQNGTVRVQAGDRVRRGDVLGLVGNTGNSTQPHLHFHVMDSPSPLVSNGLPYTFDRFNFQATVDVTTDPPTITPVPPPQRRHAVSPMALDLVAFPAP